MRAGFVGWIGSAPFAGQPAGQSGDGVIAEAWIEAAYPNPNDSSGWVLAVRGNWPASTFASFDLDPNGTPKLVVNVANRAGFERSGGAAVATTRTKQIVATTPLRRAYPDSTQTIGFPGAALDETLNADNTRTVRFALAEPVYPGETLTLTALAGWRATLPAESSVAVTNNSTRALLRPWARWAIPQDELVDGTSFTPEIVCVSHTPRHDGSSLHQPVAGVRFVASDGTNTVSAWALETTESTRYGDSLWCHRVAMDLDALTSGRITIHAEVYPWEGAVWTTRDGYWEDPHITQNYKSVTDRGWQVHLDPRPEVPLCIVLDKTGTFLPRLHVVLAPDGMGTATPSEAACVRTTYADAAAIPAADRPSTMGAAIDCMMRVTRSVAAANGFSAMTNLRFPGGATVWCPAGTRDLGTTFGAFYTPRLVDYGNVIVRPVPGVGRTEIVFNKASSLGIRVQRLSVRGCTLNSTSTTAMFPSGLPYVELDDVVTQGTNCNIRTGNPGQVFGSTTTGSLDLAHWFTRSEVQAVNSVQGCGVARASRVETHTNPPRLVAAFNCWRQNAVTQTLFDVRWDGCVFLNCRTIAQPANTNGFFVLFGGQATDNPASPATRNRVAFVNCLWERTGATTSPGAAIGELDYSQVRNLIFDGCTMVGARFNFHNDPTGTASNYHFEVTRLGCIFDRNATKHDIFSTQPLHTGGWEISYGVRQRDMLSADRFDYVITSNFPHDFVGLNVVKGSLTPGFTTNLGYVEDRSGESHDTALRSTGNGDYRLTPASPAWELRSAAANYPADPDGSLRGLLLHAGAYGVSGTGASGTIYFGDRTLVGQGAAPIAAPDGTYGQFTVAGGMITPNTSPLTVGTTQINGVDVVVRNGNGDGARTVSNQTELDQVLALSSAPAWDTLEMRPGTYQFPVNFDSGTQGAGLRARSMVIRADVIPNKQNIANPNWSWVVIQTAALTTDIYSQWMIRLGGHAAPWEMQGIRFHRPEANYEDTGIWPGDLSPQASHSCVRFDSPNSNVFRFYRCLFSSNILPPTVDGGGFVMEMTGMWNRNANVEVIECGTHRLSVSFLASQSNATNSRTIVRDCLYVDTSNDGCVLSESSTTGYTYVEMLNNHWQGFYSDGGVLHQDMNHRYKNRVYGIRRGNTFAPGPNFALNSVGAADDEVLAGRARYIPNGAFNFERGAIPADGSNAGTGHHARNGVPNSTSDDTDPQTAAAVGTLPAAAGEAGSVYRIRCTNNVFPSTIQTSGGESIWSADGTTVIGTSLVAPSSGRGVGVWSDGVRWRLIPRRCWGRQWFVPCYSSTTLNPVLHNRANLRCFTQGGQIIIDIDGTTDAIWYSAVTWLEGSNGVVLRPAAGQTIQWRGQTYTNTNPMVFPRKGFCAGINRAAGSSVIQVDDAAIPVQGLFANRNGPLQDGGDFISEHNIAIGVTASRGISCNPAGGGFEEWHRYNTVLQLPGLNDAGQVDGTNPRVSSGWLAGSGTGVVGLDHTQGVRLSGNVCTGRFTTDSGSDPATHVGGVQMQPTSWIPASQLHTLMEAYFGPPQDMLNALTREQVIAYATPRADTPEGQALINNWYGAVNGRYNWTTGQLTGATGPAPLRTLNPANGASGITVNVQPTIDCTQHITAGPGTVTIWNATTSTAVETFAASNTDRVQITANRIRIIPSNSLPGGANIQIRYTGDAFLGEHSAFLPEETGSGWQFATEQASILVVDSRLPFDKGAMTWQANNTEPSARTPDYQTLGTAGGGWLSAAWLTNNGASASYTRADMRTSVASVRRWGTADTAFQPPPEGVPYAFVMDIARTGANNQNLGILSPVPGASVTFSTAGAGTLGTGSFWGQTQRWFQQMNNPTTPSPTDPVWWRIIFLCIRAVGENGLILSMLGTTLWNSEHFFRGGTLVPLDPQVAANRDAIFAASWPSV